MWNDASEESITLVFKVENQPNKEPACSIWLGVLCMLVACSADFPPWRWRRYVPPKHRLTYELRRYIPDDNCRCENPTSHTCLISFLLRGCVLEFCINRVHWATELSASMHIILTQTCSAHGHFLWFVVYLDCLCGLVVRVPGHITEIYCVSCEVRTEFLCYPEESRPPLGPSDRSSWLQIQMSWFDSRRYQIFWEVVVMERGTFSLVSGTEELLRRKVVVPV
jgi:hypothetical protein